MKATLVAMWRLFQAFFFYPILLGLFIWIWITDKHWLWGLAIVIAILIFDPIWRILGENIWKMIKNRN